MENTKNNNVNVEDIDAIFSVLNQDPAAAEERRQARLHQDERRQYFSDTASTFKEHGNVEGIKTFRQETVTTNAPKREEIHKMANTPQYQDKARIAAQKSIGSNKQTEVSNRKTTTRIIDLNPIMNKVSIILLAITIALSLSVGTIAVFGDDIADAIKAEQNMEKSIDLLKAKAIFNLISNDLAGLNTEREIVFKSNTIENYRKLNISSKTDIYIYSLILPTEEFNKLIQTVNYNGSYYYTSIEQFLRINGYFDKSNSPSMLVFHNYIEAAIKKNSESIINTYDGAYDDGIFTYGEMIKTENVHTTGGRK